MDTEGTVLDMTKTSEKVKDRRRRMPFPVSPGPGHHMDLVERTEAAELAGVTVRTITRWASLGYLTKFEDARGRVRFSKFQVQAMNDFEPEDTPGSGDGTVAVR